MKSHKVDWRLVAGFGALLFLIVVIGLIGIFQIRSLSKTVDDFGESYLPTQRAILEMKINNGVYAMGIRSYIFWRGSKYLEAAGAAADLGAVDNAARSFRRYLAIYSSHIQSKEQALWVNRISDSQQELRAMGNKIIVLADQFDQAGGGTKKRKELEAGANKLIMRFENKLYRINNFLDKIVEKDNLKEVKEQLIAADLAENRAISLLGVSLIIAFLIGGETAWLVYRNRRRERERREQLVRRMIRLEEKTRTNLSLQIHNQMGQDLSALMIYSDLIDKKLIPSNEEAKKDIIQSKKILSGLIDKSHNIAELLRPPALEEIGLVDTIAGLIFQYKHITSVKFSSNLPAEPLILPGEYSLILYRVVQEGLTNIVKHSQAKEVKLSLEKKANVVYLTVADDGIGFNYKQPLARRRKEDKLKLGLLGLRERIELLGGKITVDTAPGRGTKLIVELSVTKV